MVTDDAVEWSEDTDDYPAALSTNATPGTYQMDVTGDVMKELEVDAASTTQSLVLTHAQGGMLAEGDVLVLDDDTLFEVPAGMAEEVEGTINEAVEPSGDGTAGGTGFTWTLLDPNISLGAGDVVTDIGLYVESPGTYTGCIVRQESATDYTVMATCSIVHSGVGYQYGALSSAYVVPNDGYTYRIATVQPAPSNNSLAVGSGYRSYSGSASTIGSQYTFSSVVSGYVPCNAWKVDISRYTYTMTPAAALDSVPSEARKLPAIKLASGKKAYEAGSKIGDNNATGTAMIEFVSSTSGGMETGDEFICDAESIVRTAIVSEIDNGDSTYTYTLTDISPALSSTPTSIYLPQVVQFEEEDFVARGIASIVKSTPETEFYTGGTIAASTALTRMSTGAQLPVKRISHLGFSTSTACTGTIFIMQDATAPDFTVIDSVSLTHTGSGEMEYVELDEHFDVPSTGYFLAVHVNTAADNLLTSSGTGGYYIAGGASGTQTWTAFSGNDVCCGYKTTQYLVTCDKQEFDFEDEIRRIAAGITADDFSAYTATIEQGEGEGDWATATLALVLTETGFKTTTSSMEEYSA
jgi:hypothetical protein